MARKADPAKKENIIIAAITVFARRGFAGARMAEVAQEAGIGKGTIYEYFRSKQALFYATFEYLMLRTSRQMEAIAATISGSAAQRLEAVAEGVLSAWLPNLELYGLVLEFWSATTTSADRSQFRSAFQKGYVDFRKTLAELIQDGIDNAEFDPRADPMPLAAAIIGSWDALLLQAWLDPDFDPLAASRSHMAVVLNGLRLPLKTQEQS